MKKTIELKDIDLPALFGVADSNLKIIESALALNIVARGNKVIMDGDTATVNIMEELMHEMMQTLNRKGSLSNKDVQHLIQLVSIENGNSTGKPDSVVFYGRKGAITARTEGQKSYINAVRKNDIVFSVGPAGTGKTYLAVAFAVSALENNQVERIILCRPAVEAGENLGFLPGDLKEKVDPYLAPLYDALDEMVPTRKLKLLMEQKRIEIIPLAYMRGRTLNNAFLILDEAQNTTSMQMKMFLTRLGVNSRTIITGDITQIDLPTKTTSGLVEVSQLLKNIDGIEIVYLGESDVVRHNLIKAIIKAYDQPEDSYSK